MRPLRTPTRGRNTVDRHTQVTRLNTHCNHCTPIRHANEIISFSTHPIHWRSWCYLLPSAAYAMLDISQKMSDTRYNYISTWYCLQLTFTGCGKIKEAPIKFFCCFLSNRLELYVDILQIKFLKRSTSNCLMKCDEKRRIYRLFNTTAYRFLSVKMFKASSYNTNSITSFKYLS